MARALALMLRPALVAPGGISRLSQELAAGPFAKTGRGLPQSGNQMAIFANTGEGALGDDPPGPVALTTA